jgi:hypothetical protein
MMDDGGPPCHAMLGLGHRMSLSARGMDSAITTDGLLPCSIPSIRNFSRIS